MQILELIESEFDFPGFAKLPKKNAGLIRGRKEK
jgi:hypothetical protein